MTNNKNSQSLDEWADEIVQNKNDLSKIDRWALLEVIMPPSTLGAIIARIADGTISNNNAKILFDEIWNHRLAVLVNIARDIDEGVSTMEEVVTKLNLRNLTVEKMRRASENYEPECNRPWIPERTDPWEPFDPYQYWTNKP